MNIGILIPGFAAHADDWALPVYQNLVRELARNHDVRVIALRYPHTRQSYLYHGARVYPLGYGATARGLSRLRLWWETWRLVRRLHQERPFDVLHGIWADETGALAGWIGQRLAVPSVVTVAGGELARLPEIHYGGQLSRYGRWITRQALQQNTVCVVPSRLSAACQALPLGYDPALFFPAKTERLPNHLVHVGSLIPVKQQRLLLETVAKLDYVTLDLIGVGYLEIELKAYAESLGIAERVSFVGNVPHEQLRDYYARAQLHVLTSYHEAFAMVVIEAAACGTPTIGTPVGILADDARLGAVGQDADSLAAHIDHLLQDPTVLQQLRHSALIATQTDYTIATIAAAYADLYQSLAS